MAEGRRKGVLGEFYRGLAYVPRAVHFLRHHMGLLKYLVIPFIINVLTFSLAVFLGMKFFGRIVDGLPQGDAWYFVLLYGVLWVLAGLVAAILVFFTFTVIGNLIAAPFNGLLSERVEILLTGNLPDMPFTLKGVLRDTGRSLVVEAKKMLLFILVMALLLLLNLLPVVGTFLYAVCTLGLTLFFLAWEYLSFVHERKPMNFSRQWHYLMKRKTLLLGFSTGVLALLAIPFLQLLCIPFAVVAATLLWCEEQAGHRLSV
ncbi:CysZ protein [Syntrophotalea carbinolica DSM 2380]|uniref:CysZ protein n=1 Tax=Syntrophotalea carbinolica (strain DSM 2380 / NBRC 103641 / GraBd1) TaxID=338963 RepID=Q3A5T3_SYNC1|nr:EI24 domain-containing protein [Syntrophotalea carbinolica]ABA88274.1 CysZ protein [Syntrophotalea carbinolica DSM 2380]